MFGRLCRIETTLRAETLERLAGASMLVERRIRPDGRYEGWNGREVLCHLAAYARLIGAALRGVAEDRTPTETELYGRSLTADERRVADLDDVNAAVQREYAGLSYEEALAFWRRMDANVAAQIARLSEGQLAAPGPAVPPHWTKPHLVDIVTALIGHYEGHMAEA